MVKFKITAQSFNAYTFLKWINGSQVNTAMPHLRNPAIVDAIRFLGKLSNDYPSGISKPEFVKYFIGTDNVKFLPIILSLRTIAKSEGHPIPMIFNEILAYSDIFKTAGDAGVESVKFDLEVLKNHFLGIDDPSSPLPVKKLPRLSKNEKKKALFKYLLLETANEVVNSLNTMGKNETANLIRSNPTMLLDSSKLMEQRIISPNVDFTMATMKAVEITKTILSRVEPIDYEYNYNLLVNSAMHFAAQLSSKEYNKYFKDYMMGKILDESYKPERVAFDNESWIHPYFIVLISFVLNALTSQIKF
jgi:hypothetical protein